MEENDKETALLKRACKFLGFRLIWRRSYFKIYDAEGREYKRCSSMNDFILADGIAGIRTVEEFLGTEMFEHYQFSPFTLTAGRLKIVENSFYGMSREQLEIRLALEGGGEA